MMQDNNDNNNDDDATAQVHRLSLPFGQISPKSIMTLLNKVPHLSDSRHLKIN